MSQEHKAAPDVDLAERGLRLPHLVLGAALLGGVLLYGRSGAGGAEQAEGASSPLWLIPWFLLRLFQLLCILALGLLVLLAAKQRSILYVPVPPGTARSPRDNPPMLRSPENWNMPFEDLTIVAPDGTRLHAWLIYQPLENLGDGEVPYTLVYFHGNAGNIGHRLENIRDMFVKLKVNVIILDYRGYGDSADGGGPCEKGLLMDARATYAWLVNRVASPPEKEVCRMSTDRVLFFGRSVGGAVAVRLFVSLFKQKLERQRSSTGSGAPLPVPAGLILENTFTSLRDMAICIFPFLGFLRPLLRSPLVFDEWRSSDDLEFLASRHNQWCCCLLSGLQDQIVPPAQMKSLHGILKRDKPKVLNFFTVKNGGHNDTPHKGGAMYWEALQKFMASVQETEPDRLAAARDRSKSK